MYLVNVPVQCRLEANYAHQQELDMIPLMMQKDYNPQGWRKSPCQVSPWFVPMAMLLTWKHCAMVVGLLMGTRLWYVRGQSYRSTSRRPLWFR